MSKTSSLARWDEDLKAIIPGYTAMLDAQGKVIYQNARAVKEYINQLRRQ